MINCEVMALVTDGQFGKRTIVVKKPGVSQMTAGSNQVSVDGIDFNLKS